MADDEAKPVESTGLTAGHLARAGFGGALMGLANLVPGISGGTMLLAAGVYPRFIEAVGDLTRLRWSRAAVVLVGVVVLAAVVAVGALAGPVKDLVVERRWIMYALFIGLTLGGVPTVWRLIRADGRRAGPAVWGGVAGGLAAMLALVWWQAGQAGGGDSAGWGRMVLAGVAGASAMILPGVSGGYLLLVIGAYVPILAGIEAFVDAGKAGDIGGVMSVGLSVILPVGLGVVLGIAAVSNLLRWLLHRFRGATLGVLLGLLVGAVAGLYPFQQGESPREGDVLKGQSLVMDAAGVLVFEDTLKPVEPDDYPVVFFEPESWQIAAALGLLLVGFAVTLGVDRIGRMGETAAGQATTDAPPTGS